MRTIGAAGPTYVHGYVSLRPADIFDLPFEAASFNHVFVCFVREPAVQAGLMSAADFDRGIADLKRTAETDGVFCYTFFKARARSP